MANSFAVSRNHLIFGLCLPLAVLLGYMLAEPLEAGSLAAIVLVISVLLFPLVLKWHHPLLVLCWNASITPYFLPGRPALWMLMAALSLSISVLARSVSLQKKLIHVPTITRPVLCLLMVVVVTGMMTGGFGSRFLGSQNYGGKGYFLIAAAVIGYFALSSQAIPRSRANLYIALFTLSGVTGIISNLAYFAGAKFYFLYELFPVELAMDQAAVDTSFDDLQARIAGAAVAAEAVFGFLLARYGARGIFDLRSPWRLLLIIATVFFSMFAGFRSILLLLGLTFAILFIVEGLWRTRVMAGAIGVAAVLGAIIIAFSDRMPGPVQRTLSFLPVKIDPAIKQMAQDSTEWRVEMWRLLWPDVPKYLFKGKGYALDAQALYLATEAHAWGRGASYESFAYAGDYHNGTLSIIIPFGIYGIIAFLWLLAAGIKVLYNNYRYGDPELRLINGYLLSFFIARAILFFVVFGALASGLYYFMGALGLSVALNHGEKRPGWEIESNTD
jgi:hypothetical protein